MIDELHELQHLLTREIPITEHFRLQVAEYNQHYLRLDAPLAENVNHSGTAFGGSLSALLTLAGWSMVWFLLKEQSLQGEIVIQDSTCKYLHPVRRDFSALCYRPAEDQLSHFNKMLYSYGKGRLELHAEVLEGDVHAVSFVGRYVAVLA
ncbi:YiiD C-terminal domain-containing protein [Dictyobacter arantiisoli]|uniref:Thioesterase putative domain-containing protein n=1 Tax=Dictyobacter arantiisoli TaxID=2014874 RepID=A0A5A5T638_9CHLR|nr:YiiD C-terminal domain-containing protein [Dictyobacter arantiisoli]GCF06910.1 hypothetical protein KDI_04740 [Dictyobacter arantiisoli]